MSRNHNYTTRTLVNYMDYQKYFKLIGTDFSSQTNTCIPHYINFVGNIEGDDGATMFCIAKSRKKLL